MRQTGQLLIYSWLAAAAVMLVMGIAIKFQSSRLESCKTEHAAFVAQVKANGKIAEAEKIKEDAYHAKQLSDANSERDAALKRLHGNHPPSRRVPDNSAGPNAGSTVCIPTSTYNSAMGRFGESLTRLVADARRYAQVADEAQIDAKALIQAWPLKMDVQITP